MKYKQIPLIHHQYNAYEVSHKDFGHEHRGLIVVPNQSIKRIIVYLRGGKGRMGRVRLQRLLQFASPNTLVIAPYYPGSNGSSGHDEFSGIDLRLTIRFIERLTEQFKVYNCHVIGFSRGGVQALHTALEIQYVRSVIMYNATISYDHMYDERPDLRKTLKRVIGKLSNRYEYDKRNPLLCMSKMKPTLILHGTLDRMVTVDQALVLKNMLYEANIEHQFIEYSMWHSPYPYQYEEVKRDIYRWVEYFDD